ncbi:MAG: prolyl oligopeptidase family serine peptidase [Polaromonas sp.]|nr:prolyl oligopeptidase family serine peptidase [Polaromonas sp.]
MSPHEVADKVFKTVHVTAITGAKDSNTKPEQVTGYIQTLQARGVKARYIEVPHATHEAGILELHNCVKWFKAFTTPINVSYHKPYEKSGYSRRICCLHCY